MANQALVRFQEKYHDIAARLPPLQKGFWLHILRMGLEGACIGKLLLLFAPAGFIAQGSVGLAAGMLALLGRTLPQRLDRFNLRTHRPPALPPHL